METAPSSEISIFTPAFAALAFTDLIVGAAVSSLPVSESDLVLYPVSLLFSELPVPFQELLSDLSEQLP